MYVCMYVSMYINDIWRSAKVKSHLFTFALIFFHHRLSVLFMDDLGQISPSKAIVAGSVAGMLAAIVIYPTDVIKTRLIVQNSMEPTYRGIIHALCTVYYQEGFRSLYRGVSLSILGMSSLLSLILLLHKSKYSTRRTVNACIRA